MKHLLLKKLGLIDTTLKAEKRALLLMGKIAYRKYK